MVGDDPAHAGRAPRDRRRLRRRGRRPAPSTHSSPPAADRRSDSTTSTSTRSVAAGTCGCSRTRSSTTVAAPRGWTRRRSPTTWPWSRTARASPSCTTARRRPPRRSSRGWASRPCGRGSGRWAASSSATRCTCSGPRCAARPIPGRATGSAGIRWSRGWRPTTPTRWRGRRSSGRPMPGCTRSTATPSPPTTTTRTCSGTRSTRTWPTRAGSSVARTRPAWCTWPVCPGAVSTSAPSTGPGRAGAPPGRRRRRSRIASHRRTRCSPATSTGSGWRRRRSAATGARSSRSTSPPSRGGRGRRWSGGRWRRGVPIR